VDFLSPRTDPLFAMIALSNYILSITRVTEVTGQAWKVVINNHARTTITEPRLSAALQRAREFREMTEEGND
jgi:hypothetical protein